MDIPREKKNLGLTAYRAGVKRLVVQPFVASVDSKSLARTRPSTAVGVPWAFLQLVWTVRYFPAKIEPEPRNRFFWGWYIDTTVTTPAMAHCYLSCRPTLPFYPSVHCTISWVQYEQGKSSHGMLSSRQGGSQGLEWDTNWLSSSFRVYPQPVGFIMGTSFPWLWLVTNHYNISNNGSRMSA